MALQTPDAGLVHAAAAGEPDARAAVVDQCLRPVLRWCSRLGGRSVDPEDAAHDVLIIVLERIGRLRDPERFPSWLFGITRRVLASHRRRAWIGRWLGSDVEDRATAAPDPSEVTEGLVQARRVQTALDQLTAAHREVLVLADIEERTEGEVAEILDLPLGTVRSRIRRARMAFVKVAPRHGLHAVVFGSHRERA